jgi:hypothetical protein
LQNETGQEAGIAGELVQAGLPVMLAMAQKHLPAPRGSLFEGLEL